MLCLKLAERVANSVGPDETSHFAASHPSLHCLLRHVWHMVRVILRQTGKIMTLSSVITDRLLITMVGLIIDYLFSSD